MENDISNEVKMKGEVLFRDGKIEKELETDKRIHFKVEGETETHSVIFDKEKNSWFCDCRWGSLKNSTCSHIFAAKLKSKE